jgi:hypothetical protein
VISGLVLALQTVLVLATGSVLLFLLQFPWPTWPCSPCSPGPRRLAGRW